MCTDCGCHEVSSIAIDGVKVPEPFPEHPHSHLDQFGHTYEHSHSPEQHGHSHIIPIHQGILAKNDRMAEQNRDFFFAIEVFWLSIYCHLPVPVKRH